MNAFVQVERARTFSKNGKEPPEEKMMRDLSHEWPSQSRAQENISEPGSPQPTSRIHGDLDRDFVDVSPL